MQLDAIEPELDDSQGVLAGAETNRLLCWTCGTCDTECPVFCSTGRLRPQKTIRLANLGLTKNLLTLPDVWYCLMCRRCVQGCPNNVKPYELHRHLREEAFNRGLISAEFINGYRQLITAFQRVRWRTVAACFKGPLDSVPPDLWRKWLKTPLREGGYYPIEVNTGTGGHLRGHSRQIEGNACFTCNECSLCCPIFGERNAFDPLRIIRMSNLGLEDLLIRSPSIWLCLGCRSCSDFCSQGVRGCELIRGFQDQAIAEGIVEPFFRSRLHEADRLIYPRFLDEIDALLGLYSTRQPGF
jgi:heterodisulfide reductase subunit C